MSTSQQYENSLANGKLKQKHFHYMDVLNVVACIAVIILHCSSGVFLNAGGWHWRYCVVAQSAFIFAVPVFFMISGANLLGYRKRYSTKEFFQKRMRRILGVFIGCSILIYALQCLPIAALGGGWRQPSLFDFIRSFLDNSINNIYWYFYAVIGLYLVTPVFSKIVDNKQLLEYAIAICFTMSVVFPMASRLMNGYEPFANFTYPYLSSWLLYFLAGYYINTYLNRRIPFPILTAIALICIAFMTGMTIHTNDVAREALGEMASYDSFYANAMSLPGSILSISLFICGKQLENQIATLKYYPTVRKLSALSLGIYAIHLQILYVFNYFLGDYTWPSLIMRALVVYLITAGIVWLYRLTKTKVLARLKR